MTDIEAPAELDDAGRSLWDDVLGRFELDVHERLLLLQAGRTADTLQRLADATKDAPLTVTNSKGDEVANPLLTEARQQSIVLSRLLAALRLPDDETGGRPQRRGTRGAYLPRRLGAVN